MGLESASTVVGAIDARSAVVHQSVSTVGVIAVSSVVANNSAWMYKIDTRPLSAPSSPSFPRRAPESPRAGSSPSARASPPTR